MGFNSLVHHTIMLNVSPDSPRIEGYAAASITPGYLLKWDSTGKLIGHSGADGTTQSLFAVEDDINTIDTVYTTGSRVIAYNMRPGDLVWAWLESGDSSTIGEYLTSNGAGLLQTIVTPTPGCFVAVAKETLTTVASDTRIKVEIM